MSIVSFQLEPGFKPPTMAVVEREYILKVLAKAKGDKRVASRWLGISAGKLYRLIDKWGMWDELCRKKPVYVPRRKK